MKYLFNKISFFILMVAVLASCKKEEALTPPLTVDFETKALSVSSKDKETEVKITFAKALNQEATVVLAINSDDLTYGEKADFYTNPVAKDNKITLKAQPGDKEVSFKLLKNDFIIEGEKKITIKIASVKGESILEKGKQTSLSIIFSENLALASGKLMADMGGSKETHQVFIDLSRGKMIRKKRSTWHIGFNNTTGKFNVILNNAYLVTGGATNKSDINDIVDGDWDSFKSFLTAPNFTKPSGNYIDDASGDLDKSVIGEVSATDENNKVYIVGVPTEEGRAYFKIKVVRESNGYKLSYGKVDDETTSTVTITKNDNFAYTHFNLLTKQKVEGTPQKKLWDFALTQYVLRYPFGDATISYNFKDYIISNRQNVKVAQIEGDAVAYSNYTKDKVSEASFSEKVNALGANWRKGGGPGTAPKVFDDRFFVINDTEGNFYKIRFTNLTNPDNEERGFISFEYERL